MDSDVKNELQELRRRVAALEEQIFRTHRVKRCVHDVISKWPGPFTVRQIEDALKEFHPSIFAEAKAFSVASKVRQLERAGIVTRLNDGIGSLGALFERARAVPEACGRPGAKYNSRAKYESGFRHIVRSALDDLPAEFTLADVRAWMAQHMPAAKIPYGSWSSTLYKLTQSQELVCVKGRGTTCSTERKVFQRGPRRVAPSGEEVREMEAAWSEFRKQLKTEKAS